ncbi:MAG: 50S ribosomal protein L5 [Planctomycetes bacterium]|jgi:large subunit ribosomal protein L5|nr:50S ribosomal protein L5 [Planctomycetota bacterium]
MVARLQDKYKTEVIAGMKQRFGYGNPMAVPKLSKIVISMGMGQAHQDQAKLEVAQKQLAMIAGQRPIVTLAKKSISNFKLREGMKVGLKVTLRGQRMYEFLDRLITLAIPRVKDFRGLNVSGFDGRGNYNMGLTEQTVFPEIDTAGITFTQGMNIAVQTTAKTDEEARELLSLMGMPFRRG